MMNKQPFDPHRARRQAGRVLVIVVALIALVCVGAGAAYIGFNGSGSGANYGPIEYVRRGDLTISINESGTLANRDQEVVINRVEGQTTILWIVEEGDYVKEGDLLVELDASDLEDELVNREISVQNAEADYVRARENLEVTKNENESDIAQAELDLRFAKVDLQRYVEGEYQQQLEQYRADIAIAEGSMNRAQNEFHWSQTLADEGFITEMELLADRLNYERAVLDHRMAESRLRVFETYTHLRELEQLESDVEQAERRLERVRLRANSNLVQAEANYEAAYQSLQREQRQLQHTKRQIEHCRIYAPASGMVVYETSVNQGRWGTRDPLRVRDTVRERQELIYLPSSQGMIAEIMVHESALSRIEPGMRAIVRADARPDREYTGTITRIAQMPDAFSLRMNPDLTLYPTRINIDSSASELRTGMSARAEIIIDELQDVLYVPIQSVVRYGDRHYVFVPGPDRIEARRVRIGMDNNNYLHIREGLQEGEPVLLAPPIGDALEEDDDVEIHGLEVLEDVEPEQLDRDDSPAEHEQPQPEVVNGDEASQSPRGRR